MINETRTGASNPFRPLALTLTVLGALARLTPHPPNMTPVGAVSLFAGARLSGWQAYLVPLLLMAITDPIQAALYGIPAYSRGTFLIYGSFLISVWIGRHLRASENAMRVAVAAFLGSLQFFLISNFGTWLFQALYPHTAAGLLACYVAAIPFFARTLAGDFLFTALIFGLHAWLSRTVYPRERVGFALS